MYGFTLECVCEDEVDCVERKVWPGTMDWRFHRFVHGKQTAVWHGSQLHRTLADLWGTLPPLVRGSTSSGWKDFTDVQLVALGSRPHMEFLCLFFCEKNREIDWIPTYNIAEWDHWNEVVVRNVYYVMNSEGPSAEIILDILCVIICICIL